MNSNICRFYNFIVTLLFPNNQNFTLLDKN